MVVDDHEPFTADHRRRHVLAVEISMVLAPLLSCILGKQGVIQFLGEQQQVQSANPDLMASISSMLDSNRDGSVVDDLSRIAGNFFK